VIDGHATLTFADGWTAALEARRFKENFPAGFSAARVSPTGAARLSFAIFPAGGCWPRTDQAFYAETYQFEGGRRKTVTLCLKLGNDAARSTTVALHEPLLARAPAAWYRGTGAVLPLPDAAWAGTPRTELEEAMQRYDRLQRAKVRAECSDPVGVCPLYEYDRWGKISIPDLWERCPETFAGCMNFGDLVWSFGYCSLFYDWPLAMLTQYLRLDDPMLLTVGQEMVRHRYDIDQYHVENTQPYLAGFQRDERGQHGHLARQEALRGRNVSWESNARPSHTWNRGLLLYWALTGDPRALAAAQANGRAFHRFFYEQHELGKKAQLPFAEFRTPAWAMDNWLALYEYTGDSRYLVWAEEVFDKTLLAMERAHGQRGHILKDGRQGAQFVGYMVEPVCRLHHYTRRRDVAAFLKRVLDWQRQAGALRGFTKNGIYYPVMWREDWDYNPELDEAISIGVGHHYDYPLCDGYAYLYRLYRRKRDREFARQLFTDITFYQIMCEVQGKARSPIGYHHLGKFFGFTPKLHAWSGRYAQIFLQDEADL
jgi:hypothetical protein